MIATGKDHFGVGGVLAMIGVAAVLVLCCAGAGLIAAGALGVLGEALRNGWLIGAAVLTLISGVDYTLRRGARRHRGVRWQR